jgi:multidrug efflux pump subunit AcrA (membrane-fusion protein)
MFVDVELTGRKIDRAYLLPRSAIHLGNLVYLAENNHLVIQPVKVLRRLNDSVYVGEGLNDGDLVITTPVSAPTEGMKLRLRHGTLKNKKNHHESTKEGKHEKGKD